MALRYSFQIGTQKINSGERGDGPLIDIYFASLMTDDSTYRGIDIQGSSPEELARRVKSWIDSDRNGEEEFAWDVRSIPEESQSLYRRGMGQENEVLFRNTLSYAPPTST